MDDGEQAEAYGDESDRVERKESDRDTEEMLRATCALANDLGNSGRAGFLVLGVRKDGMAVGVDTSDSALQSVVSRLQSTRILPSPSIVVQANRKDGLGVIVVRVEPYPVPPVVKVDGVAWVRVGPTSRRATDADLARLQERRPEGRLPFDQRALPYVAFDALNLAPLKASYAELSTADGGGPFPSFEQWLGQREIARRSGPAWVPTVAGLLMFGASPQAVLPGAFVEFVRYGGTDFDAHVVARKTITGALPDQLELVWAQLQAHVVDLPTGTPGIRTTYGPDYPIEALKELARNLVQHRLYEGTNAPGRISWMSDRIVFNNPGARFGRASEGEFGEHSDYRNPTVTRFLVESGYVERLGRGIRRVQASLTANGSPPLEVETDGYTTVTIRRRP